MKKYLLKSLAFAACAFLASDALAANYVVVSAEGSDDVEFAIGNSPKVTFTATDLVIASAEATVSYPLTTAVTFRFSDTPGIADVATTAASFRLDGDMLTASGLAAGDTLEVYDLRGMRLAAAAAIDGEAGVEIGAASGILIVKTNKTSFKIAK